MLKSLLNILCNQIFLSGIILLIGSENAFSKPLAQQIFEHQIKMKCDDASVEEVNRLKKTCSPNFSNSSSLSLDNNQKNLKNIDKIVEYLTFKSIGKLESKKLSCMMENFRYLKDNVEIQKPLVDKTCTKLGLLKDSLDNQAFIESWLDTYYSANDRSIRTVPKNIYEKNQTIIKQLKDKLFLYQKVENMIRGTDSLLSSVRIYEAIKSKLKGGFVHTSDTPKEVCAYLSENISNFLNDDYESIHNSKKFLDENMNQESNNWVNNEKLKISLWASSSRNDYLSQFVNDPNTKKSTYCRMEGRYGEGIKAREALYYLGYLSIGVLTGGVSRIVVAAVDSESTIAALYAVKIALVADIAGTVLVGAKQTFDVCNTTMSIVSEARSCNTNLKKNYYNLYSQKENASQCVLSAAMNILSIGFSSYLAHGALAEAALENNFIRDMTLRSSETEKKILELSLVTKK